MRPDELNLLLARVAAGALDELTVAEVDALARFVDDDAQATARLASVALPSDMFGVRASVAPTIGDWARMEHSLADAGAFGGVNSERMAAGAVGGRHGSIRLLRWGPSLAAVAACGVIAVMFSLFSRPAQAERFVLESDTQIASLEVEENSSSMVVMPDGEEQFAVIVVMESEGSEEQESVEVIPGGVPVVEMSMD